MVQQRKKPAKLMWTQSWRRLNKKGKDEGVTKKRSRKAVRVTRAIVGASVEEVRYIFYDNDLIVAIFFRIMM